VSEGNRLLPGEGDLQDLLIDYVFRSSPAVKPPLSRDFEDGYPLFVEGVALMG